MHAAPALLVASGGFLLAVLWMDLLFDLQVLRHRGDAQLPEAVLASIAGYYRRVTTEARPLGHLIALVMLIGLATLIAELVLDPVQRAVNAVSLALFAAPVLLGMLRVFPDAVRLGSRRGTLLEQTALARSICREHLLCFGAIGTFIALRVACA